jgi:signal transduction histidine kinase
MRERLFETLQRLLELPAANLEVALSAVADHLSSALGADKTDVFLHLPEKGALVAVGRSDQPLSQLQRDLGLHILPLANGGRAVQCLERGGTFATGNLGEDDVELRGVREALGVRSLIVTPLEIGGQRRGVLAVSSKQPERFGADDVRFADSVARWIGIVAHRAELVEHIARSATDQGRRVAAEELMTTLAHDLRNHLSPLTVRLGLVRVRAERDGRERDVRDLDLSLRALARLSAMISDMLDVARVEQGVMHIDVQPVDMVALVEEAATTLATPDAPVEVRASQPLVVAVDPDRIRQCLENIVSNAVRHSPKGVPVVITVEHAVLPDGASGVRVDITDQGPGVPQELLPRLFERFVTSTPGGLGMGLYLAKRIARLHGGDVTVESSPGAGARFSLLLRAAPLEP